MASTKRHLPDEGLPEAKKTRSENDRPISSAKQEISQSVVLNLADCDLGIEFSSLSPLLLAELGCRLVNFFMRMESFLGVI